MFLHSKILPFINTFCFWLSPRFASSFLDRSVLFFFIDVVCRIFNSFKDWWWLSLGEFSPCSYSSLGSMFSLKVLRVYWKWANFFVSLRRSSWISSNFYLGHEYSDPFDFNLLMLFKGRLLYVLAVRIKRIRGPYFLSFYSTYSYCDYIYFLLNGNYCNFNIECQINGISNRKILYSLQIIHQKFYSLSINLLILF
jgi:hypothetical protein